MQTEDHGNPNSSAKRIAIVGGGLSGLAAAHRIGELFAVENRPLEMTLFEAGPRTGGIMGTRHIGEYLVETGADSFITNKPWAVDLCRRLGIEDRLIPTDETYRRSLVLRNDKPVPVPEGFMLLTPAKIWPVLTSPIFSLGGKLRVAWEYFVPRRPQNGQQDESLAAFVRRRFGREALDRLIQPLVGGIYTSDPERLSLRATMPRFLEMERDFRSLIRASRKQQAQQTDATFSGSGARYGLFATPAGGISELLDRLRDRVADFATLRTETAVTALKPCVQQDGGATSGWKLTLSDGSEETFDGVIPAMRSWQAARLLKSLDARLSNLLDGIEYASTAIVVSGHKLDDIRDPINAFGLVVPAVENRRILAVSFASRKFPGRAPSGRVILRTFVGGAMQPELLKHSDEELLTIVREELSDILGVSGRAEFETVCRYERAMPQYHLGHCERVAEIETLVAKQAALELAGNAYHGVGIPDCVHSGEQAAERLCASLGI